MARKNSTQIPRIILFRGKAGVGKTTISNEIAKRLNIAVTRKDDIYDELAEIGLSHQNLNKLCEKILIKSILTNFKNCTDIIVDNSYHYEDHFQRFRNSIDQHRLISVLIICSDEELWKQRFEQRKKHPQPNNRIVDFEKLKSHYRTLMTKSIKGELIIDSKEDLEQNCNKIIEWLESQ